MTVSSLFKACKFFEELPDDEGKISHGVSFGQIAKEIFFARTVCCSIPRNFNPWNQMLNDVGLTHVDEQTLLFWQNLETAVIDGFAVFLHVFFSI